MKSHLRLLYVVGLLVGSTGCDDPEETLSILETRQSASTVEPGGTVDFAVNVRNPESSALHFEWTAEAGTLGASKEFATTSEVTWTAPPCLPSGSTSPIGVEVTVRDDLGHDARTRFEVSGLSECRRWSATGAMRTGRREHTATLLPSGRVLVTGGQPGVPTTAEVYDPALGTWTATGNLNAGHATGHTSTVLPTGKVLVAGGTCQCETGIGATAELYDPQAGTWTTTGALSSPRAHHTATLLPTGKVLVAGGEDTPSSSLATAAVYDPQTGTWTATGSMASARSGARALLLASGKVLVAGGVNKAGAGPWQPLATAELYDPVTGTWTATGNLASARTGHTATLLPSGRVLVTGGRTDTNVGPGPEDDLATVELYDPQTGTWTATGAMSTPRVNHTATLLQSGRVLVTAGRRPADTSMGHYPYVDLATSELYDPAAGTWTDAGSLALARHLHQATLLSSGQVLVSGGSSFDGYEDEADLYFP